jgi:hypothetical protein
MLMKSPPWAEAVVRFRAQPHYEERKFTRNLALARDNPKLLGFRAIRLAERVRQRCCYNVLDDLGIYKHHRSDLATGRGFRVNLGEGEITRE